MRNAALLSWEQDKPTQAELTRSAEIKAAFLGCSVNELWSEIILQIFHVLNQECVRGKQGNRSWCEGLAQTQGNGKLIQDRFRSSLSGSSNKFSHVPFALKSNTFSILEWKFSYHKHQTKNINIDYKDCCAIWVSALGANTPTAHLVLWGTGTHPHVLRATAQALQRH